MPGGVHLLLQLGLDVVGQPERVGDEHAGGLRVVLGLADQVGRDVRRVGGVVGEDRDLGRTGLRVDADTSLEQALGRDRVDVAGAGDQVDPLALPRAVGEHRDRLRPADGVHLVDAEQRAGGQDRRLGEAAVVLARRARERDRRDARDLGRDDVHHHARDQGRQATGRVEPHAADRDHPVGDGRARAERGGDVVLELGLTGTSQPRDRLLEPGSDRRVELGQRSVERVLRDAQLLGGDPVEPLGELLRSPRPRASGRPRRSGAPSRGQRRRRRPPAAPPLGSPRAYGHAGRCAGSWTGRTILGAERGRPRRAARRERGRPQRATKRACARGDTASTTWTATLTA